MRALLKLKIMKDKIKLALSEKSLTVTELAKKSDVSKSSIYRWLKGEQDITVKALVKITTALNITICI